MEPNVYTDVVLMMGILFSLMRVVHYASAIIAKVLSE